MGRVNHYLRLLAVVHFLRLVAPLALLAFVSPHARAAVSSFDVDTLNDLYHITADRTLFHSREKVKEAFGHVVVSAEGKRLACDYLWVDDNSKEIKARGNVVFVDKQTTVEAAELHFNMNTGFGAIFYGRVYNDLYQLRGQLIRRVGDGHYLTTEGEYSTCKDCPESWKLAARNVDLTVEGYAFMDGVFVKIKDIPTLYLPYLVVPVKRERQSGLLFPRIGATSSHGFVYVQPLFIAIDKHQDATIAGGIYSDQGARYEAQYRYMSYNGIQGQTDVFYSRDRTYCPDPQHCYPNRGAIKSNNEWPFDPHLGARWRFYDAKDRDYAYDFPEDFDSQGRPDVESNVVVQSPWDDFFVSLEARRYVNLLFKDPVNFDTGTVQALPTLHAGVKERRLLGPVFGNVYARYDNFVRANGPIYYSAGDGVYRPNFFFNPATDDPATNRPDRIRESRRTILQPEISAPFTVGKYFAITPAVQYTTQLYQFPVPNGTLVNQTSTTTQYLRAHIDASTVFERVYNYDGEKVSKLQHQFVPFVSASYIPSVYQDPNHPFQQQIRISDGPFDQFDVVPLSNSTNFLRFPQGKSIYYGFDSRLVSKKKKPEEIPKPYPYDLLPPARPKNYPTPFNRKEEDQVEAEKLWDEFNPRYDLYSQIWDFSASQAYDFLEAHNEANKPNGDGKRAWSYVLAKSDLNIDDKFMNSMEYKYYPAIVIHPVNPNVDTVLHDEQMFTTGLTWYWKKLANLRRTRFFERSIRAGITLDDQPTPSRTVGGTLTWSFNDFVGFWFKYDWDLNAKQQTDWALNVLLTHPSECWGLALHWDWLGSRQPNYGEVGFQILINLDGSGYLGTKGAQGPGGGTLFGGT